MVNCFELKLNSFKLKWSSFKVKLSSFKLKLNSFKLKLNRTLIAQYANEKCKKYFRIRLLLLFLTSRFEGIFYGRNKLYWYACVTLHLFLLLMGILKPVLTRYGWGC